MKTIEKPKHCTKCGTGHVSEFRRSKVGRKLHICRKCSRLEDKQIKG